MADGDQTVSLQGAGDQVVDAVLTEVGITFGWIKLKFHIALNLNRFGDFRALFERSSELWCCATRNLIQLRLHF